VTVANYLAELERELRVRRAPRARLLQEVEDHLRDLTDELAAAGLARTHAESQAVARFGAAAAVAARFAQATASSTAHRAVGVTALAFAAYAAVLIGFATASPLLRDFPQGAASFFACQLGAVALVVAVVRSLRWRGQVAAPTAELVAIARAVAVATGALTVAAVAEAAVALTRPAGVIAWSEGRWLTLLFAAAGVVMLMAALAAVRTSAQAAAVATMPARDAGTAEPLLDDVDALAERAHLPRVVRRAVHNLLMHPWPTALLIAAAAFVAVTAVGVAGAHGSVASAVVLGGIEAAGILVGFATFGSLLGLRPGPEVPA
jgi:hypothetical protein